MYVGFLLFRVVLDNMVSLCILVVWYLLYYLLDFLMENFYFMTLGDVLFVSVRFVYMVRKDLFDRKDLVDQCSNFCVADLY